MKISQKQLKKIILEEINKASEELQEQASTKDIITLQREIIEIKKTLERMYYAAHDHKEKGKQILATTGVHHVFSTAGGLAENTKRKQSQ